MEAVGSPWTAASRPPMYFSPGAGGGGGPNGGGIYCGNGNPFASPVRPKPSAPFGQTRWYNHRGGGGGEGNNGSNMITPSPAAHPYSLRRRMLPDLYLLPTRVAVENLNAAVDVSSRIEQFNNNFNNNNNNNNNNVNNGGHSRNMVDVYAL